MSSHNVWWSNRVKSIWIYINDPTCSLQQQRAKPTIIWSYDTDLMGIERWYIHTQSCSYMYNIYMNMFVYSWVYILSATRRPKKRIERKCSSKKPKEYYSSIFLGINLVGKIGSGCCKKKLWVYHLLFGYGKCGRPLNKLLINQLDSGERTSMMGMVQNLPSGNLTKLLQIAHL